MTKRFALIALALAAGFSAAGEASAQTAAPRNPYVIPMPAGSFNPSAARRNIAVAPGAFRPSTPACGSGPVASLSTCQGPMYSTITVQRTSGNAGFAMLIFQTSSLTRGVATPAQVRVPLRGGPSTYTAQVPPHLCMAGGPSWQVILIGSNLQNLGTIGAFQPVGCP